MQWASYWAGIVRRCRWPKISIGSVTSVRTVSTNLSAQAFARGLSGRNLPGLDAGVGQDRVKRRGELSGTVADQEPQACGAIT